MGQIRAAPDPCACGWRGDVVSTGPSGACAAAEPKLTTARFYQRITSNLEGHKSLAPVRTGIRPVCRCWQGREGGHCPDGTLAYGKDDCKE
jgi:hypothetical protein